MDASIFDFLREIAHHKSHEAPLDKRLEWQTSAQDLLDNEQDHLSEPPDVCPVCGAPVHLEYNARYHVMFAHCEVCPFVDEWDAPDDVNPASVRY